jgi:hypothetical protein
MNIPTKFSLGERAYYVIYATASINPVDIMKAYSYNGSVYYDLKKADTNGLMLKRVPESDLLTFAEAKISLTKYLQTKLTEIDKITAI